MLLLVGSSNSKSAAFLKRSLPNQTLLQPIASVQGFDAVTDQKKPAILPNGMPAPPIPRRLRELLQDYPGHLERLQQALNTVFDGPSKAKGAPDYIFELATWALEGRLETFIREAQDELEAAQTAGDAEAIARSKAKLSLMRQARSSSNGMYDLDEIWSYLEVHKEVLR
jgi:hypothetical protein